jgi:ubiquinol-cytochrome c reductase cytochrome b subunit
VSESDALAEAAHATERKAITALKEYQDDELGSNGSGNGSSNGHH